MNILAIASAGIMISIIALTVKNMKSEIGQLISIAGVVLVVSAIIPYVITVVKSMYDFAKMSPAGENFLMPILKITGIAYISQIGSELCTDSGEKALASHIQTAGKIAITVITIPIAKEAFSKIIGILS
ncbi:MAG: hypothetical protein IJD91_04835 [Clostridia bacterium]|nr:hypothetical protein [Clostridia bacterium]